MALLPANEDPVLVSKDQETQLHEWLHKLRIQNSNKSTHIQEDVSVHRSRLANPINCEAKNSSLHLDAHASGERIYKLKESDQQLP